jgi:hypothetical protein
MSELDLLAAEAKNNPDSMNELINRYENFILKCASSAARAYVSKSDDEWSIALSAFTEAIKNYSADKGSFLSFAELVIRRRMIDYIRSIFFQIFLKGLAGPYVNIVTWRYHKQIRTQPPCFHEGHSRLYFEFLGRD